MGLFLKLAQGSGKVADMLRIISVLVLCLALYGCMGPGPELQGEVRTRCEGDTLIVDYDVAFYDAGEATRMDSLFLTLSFSGTKRPFDTLIFSQENPKITDSSSVHKLRANDHDRVAGQLVYVDSHDSARECFFRMNVVDTNLQWTSTDTTDPFILYPSSTWGLTLSAGISSFDRSVLPSYVRGTESTFHGEIEAGVTGLWRRWRSHLYGGGLGFPSSDDYISLGYVGLDVSREFGVPFSRRLSPFVGGQYSHLEVVNHPGEYTLDGFGISAGFRVGGTFDDFCYSYNSHMGGYHQFEYRAYYMSSPRGRVGTGYSFYHGDEMRAFRMRFYFEMALGGYGSMFYYNRGNLLRDLLSWGFLAPIVVLGKVVDALHGS